MLKPDKQTPVLTGGEAKAAEYLARFKAGNLTEGEIEQLPLSFRSGIDVERNKKKQEKNEPASQSEDNVDGLNLIPPQYEGIPAEVLEDIWIIPMYVDSEKTQSEQKKKILAIKALRNKESADQIKESEKDEEGENDQMAADEIRKRAGLPTQGPEVPTNTEAEDTFNTFRVKNGETVEGVFWYEYRNQEAKKMKESGTLEWGKERIYFDIPLKDMILLRDLVIDVASKEKIAIAFKYLDEAKTYPFEKDGKETRFVTNFANQEDVARLMIALQKDPRYQHIKSDRGMSYSGIRLDDVAEYASGYREQRGALERIMQGNFGSDDKYSFVSESGRTIEIDRQAYEVFKKQYEEFKTKQDEAENKIKTLIRNSSE
ncbi:MAG: hypothetical protein Q7T51_04715 [Candidatus Moranbacteria bacterium]|nr:hypothetical protein [Candidatus Moranbacteria bacterium]